MRAEAAQLKVVRVQARTLEQWCEGLLPAIAQTILDYLHLRQASLSARTIQHYRAVLVQFGAFLRQRFPEVGYFANNEY